MIFASSAREPGGSPGHIFASSGVCQLERKGWATREPLELASRAEESDEANDIEVVVGGMILGVTFGAIVIGAITFATWALGLARYTRAW